MASYNNLDSLYKALGKQIEVSLNKTANDLVELATKLIWEEFYQQYTPRGSKNYLPYERTYQLLNSIVRSKIQHSGSTYSVEIYLDPSGINYKDADAMDVFMMASEGIHGNQNVQTDGKFFEEFIKETMKSWKILLVKHGLNVV